MVGASVFQDLTICVYVFSERKGIPVIRKKISQYRSGLAKECGTVCQTNSKLRPWSVASLIAIIVVCGVYLCVGRGDWSLMGSRVALAESFDFTRHSIPVEEILSGGPPKDGIPALTDPKTVVGSDTDFLRPDDRIIGVEIDGKARAYPLRLLNWHEAVNDQLGGKPIAVTYCPLCDSSAVFEREIGGKAVEFGISGKLYNSNVLLYDRSKKESLWSQVKMEAVTGPQTGTRLETIPHQLNTWAEWRHNHPNTEVATFETGYLRNYTQNPYEDYLMSERLMFPVKSINDRYPKKEMVIGVRIGNQFKAYPYSQLKKNGETIEDTFAGKKVLIKYNPKTDTAYIASSPDKLEMAGIDFVYTFWFAWYAMHPDTEVYQADIRED